jgi:hypothetical protein
LPILLAPDLEFKIHRRNSFIAALG